MSGDELPQENWSVSMPILLLMSFRLGMTAYTNYIWIRHSERVRTVWYVGGYLEYLLGVQEYGVKTIWLWLIIGKSYRIKLFQ